MPDARSWFKKLGFSSKSKAPEPMASGALQPPGNTASASRFGRFRSTPTLAIPSQSHSRAASADLQPSPTESFWLPAEGDAFWKPARPEPRGQDQGFRTEPFQEHIPHASDWDYDFSEPQHARSQQHIPTGFQVVTSPPSEQNQLRHAFSSPFMDISAPEADFHDDIYSATPPLQSRNPFIGRQQQQSVPFTDYTHPEANIYRPGSVQPSASPNVGRQHRQSTPSVPRPTPATTPPQYRRQRPISTLPPRPPTTETEDCAICADTKTLDKFPILLLTKDCDHTPETCLECIQTHIRTAINDKAWHARVVTCPQCDKALEYNEVQQYSDAETFAIYDARILHDATAESADYFSCPAAGCGSGQVHDAGDDAPIVSCVGCSRRFCFRHRVAWHETMSCQEYDSFLRDPENFKSALERENEKVERERAAEERRKRDLEDADRRYAQNLIEDDERRQEAEAQAERERAARREMERREAERAAAQERAAAESRARVAREAKRRAADDKASEAIVKRTTKKCPGRNCGRPIEKNDGCAHMTCIKCRHQFCWKCLRDWGGGHSC